MQRLAFLLAVALLPLTSLASFAQSDAPPATSHTLAIAEGESIDESIPPHPEDSISGQYLLEEVIVSAERHTNQRQSIPSGNTQLKRPDLLRIGYRTINNLSAISPNVWIPQYGSSRSTPIYIRGIGSRSGSASAAVYLDGSPILYTPNLSLILPQLRGVEVLRGPQGTLFGRNTLAGVINLESASPFDSDLGITQLAVGSHGLYRAQAAYSLVRTNTLAISAFFEEHNREGYFYNTFRGEKADPSRGATFGSKLVWRINNASTLGVNILGGFLREGAFPYHELDLQSNTLAPFALDGESSFKRQNLLATIFYLHKAEQTTLDLRASFEALHDKTAMDQDYSVADIFQTRMNGIAKGGTLEALFKWHDASMRHQLSVGSSLFLDRNETDNPIRLGKDGIDRLLAPGLAKASQNPKLPYQITPGSTTSEAISLNYRKPRTGASIFAQYTLCDLFTEGLSVTIGSHFGYEHYTLDYAAGSQFAYSLVPKDPSSGLKPLKLNPAVALEGELSQDEFHLSPRVSIAYELGEEFSTYLSFSHGYRAGNYNEQAFADFIMEYEVKALMLALQQKTLPPQEVEATRLHYKPESGNNLEWGARGSHWGKRFTWSASLFHTWINNLQVTDFVASGLGRVQANIQRGIYRGVEIDLSMRPFEVLDLRAAYGFVDARYFAEDVGYRIPYVPQHTLSVGATYSPRFDRNRFFFEEVSLGVHYDAAGPTVWHLDGKSREDFRGTLNAQIAVRRGGYSIWARGYNLTNDQRTAFYFRSLGRTLLQPFPPLRFEIGLTLLH